MPRATPPPTPQRGAPAQQRSAQPATDNTPVHAIRHRSLKASIWRNETAKGPMYKVMVVRSYKEGDEWRDTHGFGFDDLMNVAKLLADAHTWVSERLAEEHSHDTSDEANE